MTKPWSPAGCRVGDYKLIKGEPGRFFDWFPLPVEEDEVAPTQYPTWKRRPWTPHMFPDYQLYNIKGACCHVERLTVSACFRWLTVLEIRHEGEVRICQK